ncbi:MAG: cyanophycin synthetase [bacterium]|nr:cyanophycin synthetase [bacterium]
MTPFDEYLDRLDPFGMRPGLERIRGLLASSGDPQRSLACLHVVGTNGKGSVCAMAESVLRAAGSRTGLYTSPHLVSRRERIRIDGAEAPEGLLGACAAALIPAAERLAAAAAGRPTWFEFMTAVALLAFARAGVAYAVVEAGLGGRLDATGVIGAPVVAIPAVGLEHRAHLGDTVAAIAAEKAAVIGEGASVSCGPVGGEALAVIERRCRQQSAVLRRVGADIIAVPARHSPGRLVLDVRGAFGRYDGLELPLAGRHQADNCAVALGALDALAAIGAPVTREAVYEGLAGVRWRGRLEELRGDPPLLADCAHNPAAAAAAAAALGDVYPGRRWVLVIGILADKDIDGICDALAPAASEIVATAVRCRRSAEAGLVARACRRRARGGVFEEERLPAALERADELVARGLADGVFLTGSTYLVGEAMELTEGGGA